MYHPFNYHAINIEAGTYQPSQYQGKNTGAYNYWCRSLYQRLESLFEFDIPWKGDAKNFFTYCLFMNGHVGCFNTDEFGFTFQPGWPHGQGWFYQPVTYRINNPYYNKNEDIARMRGERSYDKELIIGMEVGIIKLTSDYYGIFDIINRYATSLAELDTSLQMAITNTRFAWLLGAKNKGIAETLKKIYDKISGGQTLVIYDRAIFNDKQDSKEPSPFQYMERKDLKNSYIVDLLLRDIQNTIMEFDCEVGLPTLPYQKKERMVTDEAQAKIKDGQARYDTWFKNLDETIGAVNDLFGTSMSVKKNYDEEDLTDEPVQDDIKRP